MRKPLLASLLLLALASPAVAQKKEAPKEAPPPAPKIKVGSRAPDFTLKDQNGNGVSLASFRGKKNVVLAFYVFAFTGG
ncbi:MAG: redoxin domain-containing protein [Terriglobales bacterium]